MVESRSPNVVWHAGLSRAERWQALGVQGATVWMTGLSGSGKSTIAVALERELVARRVHAYRLDGDNLRHGLNRNLGFSADDRAENLRRVAEVARLFADAGNLVLTSFISPTVASREAARRLHQDDGLTFLEVFVDTPLEVCEQRDPKGLYAKARAGGIGDFTGVDAPYEPPPRPDLVLRTSTTPVAACVQQLVALLSDRRLI